MGKFRELIKRKDSFLDELSCVRTSEVVEDCTS